MTANTRDSTLPDSENALIREIELLNQQIALLRSEVKVLKAAADYFYNAHLDHHAV